MKQLHIYKDKKSGEFVIERVNQFNHSFKRCFITEQGLLEGLQAYLPVDEYQLEVSPELWGMVINYLQGAVAEWRGSTEGER
jgi:hypothetical protein